MPTQARLFYASTHPWQGFHERGEVRDRGCLLSRYRSISAPLPGFPRFPNRDCEAC
jgi:hypothetical protein